MCLFKPQSVLNSFFFFFFWGGGGGGGGSTVVKVPCYNSEGRWFDPSRRQWIFH